MLGPGIGGGGGGGEGGGDEGFTRFSALILNLYADTVSSDTLP